MKIFRFTTLLLLTSLLLTASVQICTATYPVPGDSEEEVMNAMGPPQGKASVGDVNVWMYPRGDVEFVDGMVQRVKLMTEEEFVAHKQGMRTQDMKRRQAEEATARGQRNAASQRRKEIEDDPNYDALTPAEQVALWDDYYKTYPQADLSPKLTAAQQALEEANAAEKVAAAQTAAETPPPKLSGSKARKARRGAGQVKPEDRPGFLTRQTLNIKDKQDDPSFLSGQTVRIPAKKEKPDYLSGQSLNIKGPTENPSFLSDQKAY